MNYFSPSFQKGNIVIPWLVVLRSKWSLFDLNYDYMTATSWNWEPDILSYSYYAFLSPAQAAPGGEAS